MVSFSSPAPSPAVERPNEPPGLPPRPLLYSYKLSERRCRVHGAQNEWNLSSYASPCSSSAQRAHRMRPIFKRMHPHRSSSAHYAARTPGSCRAHTCVMPRAYLYHAARTPVSCRTHTCIMPHANLLLCRTHAHLYVNGTSRLFCLCLTDAATQRLPFQG